MMRDPSASSVALATEMSDLTFDTLSETDIAQLKTLILDYAAVTLCGSVQPWGWKLTAWAEAYGAAGNALLIGSGRRAGAAAAALVNGTAAHGYELDDTHEATHSHPGAVIISAALAVALEREASGKEFLAAIAAGYEAMARIGRASVGTQRIHKTSGYGPFGAAVAAGKLAGLDAAGIARAWGIALSMTGGAIQFAFEPAGTEVKRMHGGIPAHNGVLAAQLAAIGISAPERSLEGRAGFFRTFGKDSNPERLIRTPGAPLESHHVSLKPYSCCRLFHTVIDALETATDGFSIKAEQIAGIDAYVPESSIPGHMMRRPDSIMAAQYSLPFIIGATLTDGPTGYAAYGVGRLRDPEILALADKVEAHGDDALAAEAPESMPARVAVRLENGANLEAKALEALGAPARPLDRDGVMNKARAVAAMTAPGIDIETISDTVDTLAYSGTVADLARLLVIEGYYDEHIER